jgi:cation diffusion facilitator CzcD-associated flavoprotein CzcO
MSEQLDVAVVGAGPYGLAAAAHLRAVNRDVRVFGETFHFWRTQTPSGMVLRSPYLGSNVGDPDGKLTLQDYERDSGEPIGVPIPVDRFLEYGDWFQQRAVPDLDRREVTAVERTSRGFRIDVGDDSFHADRLVVAAGVGTFARRPPEFDGLPAELASHTLHHHDLSVFAGRRVSVIGGGQSSLESAALLHEAGADVDVLVREPLVRWLSEGSWKHTTKAVSKVLYAAPDVGPAGVSHLVARPGLYRRMPRRTQDRLAVRSVRPAGAGWLRPRLASVPIHTGVRVTAATEEAGRLRLRIDGGQDAVVDHVLLGTGYKVDLAKYAFLAAPLVDAIECVNGYPKLADHFETSVSGLHIVGAPAAWSFGPLMRFVAGSDFAARTLAAGMRR